MWWATYYSKFDDLKPLVSCFWIFILRSSICKVYDATYSPNTIWLADTFGNIGRQWSLIKMYCSSYHHILSGISMASNLYVFFLLSISSPNEILFLDTFKPKWTIKQWLLKDWIILFFPELMLSYPFAKGKSLISFYDRKKMYWDMRKCKISLEINGKIKKKSKSQLINVKWRKNREKNELSEHHLK